MINSLGRSKTRLTVVLLAALSIAAAGMMVPTIATTQAAADGLGSSTLAQTLVEHDGADCTVPPGSPSGNSQLPDPFTKIDGSRVTTVEEWRCRRAEIKELAEDSIYGDKPDPPDSVTGSVSSSNITVNVSDQGQSTSFSASVTLPSGSGPFPAVIVYGGFGGDTNTILGSGAAVINYDPFTVGQEGTSRNNKQGAFYDIYGSSSSTGLLMAWAWGTSRIIDVIEQSGGNILEPSMGVTGCSRFGKGAFVAGAFDQRFALTMPIESGTAGVPILRGIPGESGSQPLDNAYNEQPWFGDAFGSYTGNPSGLPVDTHEVVGMIAPRGLFIMENPHIDWLGARSGSVAGLGGAEIYTALGAQDNITYWSDVQDGSHCANRSEWTGPLQQSINTFLHGSGNPPGQIRIAGNKAGDLSQWRNWQTPILDSGPPTETTPPEETTPPQETTPPPGNADCAAEIDVVNEWSAGWQGNVVITAGTGGITGWTVTWTWPGGQSIDSSWNATVSTSGSSVTASDVGWNGTMAEGQSQSAWGFVASGSSASPSVTCTAA